MDLRRWDTGHDKVVSLNGEWFFQWNALAQWNEISRGYSYAQFPVPWNEQAIDGKELPGIGFATFAVEVLLPHEMDSVAIEVPAVFNSHALWVNDQLICTNGKVGISEETQLPEWRPQTVKVRTDHGSLRIVFQIANFQTARGGCAEPVRIGSVDTLLGMHAIYHGSSKVLVIAFSVIGISFLVIFLITLRRNVLYFSGLTLSFALRFMFSDRYSYYDFGISLPWEIAAKIEYITVPLLVVWGVLFISSIYPLEFKRPVRISFLVINVLLLIAIIIAKVSWLSQLLLVIQLAALSVTLFVIYATIKAAAYERTGAWLSVAGIAMFAVAAVYNLFTFLYVLELNRIIIHSCYALGLIISALALMYRTPMQIMEEEKSILRYSDLYKTES